MSLLRAEGVRGGKGYFWGQREKKARPLYEPFVFFLGGGSLVNRKTRVVRLELSLCLNRGIGPTPQSGKRGGGSLVNGSQDEKGRGVSIVFF